MTKTITTCGCHINHTQITTSFELPVLWFSIILNSFTLAAAGTLPQQQQQQAFLPLLLLVLCLLCILTSPPVLRHVKGFLWSNLCLYAHHRPESLPTHVILRLHAFHIQFETLCLFGIWSSTLNCRIVIRISFPISGVVSLLSMTAAQFLGGQSQRYQHLHSGSFNRWMQMDPKKCSFWDNCFLSKPKTQNIVRLKANLSDI